LTGSEPPLTDFDGHHPIDNEDGLVFAAVEGGRAEGEVRDQKVPTVVVAG